MAIEKIDLQRVNYAPILAFPQADMDLRLASYRNIRTLPGILQDFGVDSADIRLQERERRRVLASQLWINENLTIKTGLNTNASLGGEELKDLKGERRRAQRRYRYHLNKKGQDHSDTQEKLRDYQFKTINLFDRLQVDAKQKLQAQIESKIDANPQSQTPKGREGILDRALSFLPKFGKVPEKIPSTQTLSPTKRWAFRLGVAALEVASLLVAERSIVFNTAVNAKEQAIVTPIDQPLLNAEVRGDLKKGEDLYWSLPQLGYRISSSGVDPEKYAQATKNVTERKFRLNYLIQFFANKNGQPPTETEERKGLLSSTVILNPQQENMIKKLRDIPIDDKAGFAQAEKEVYGSK